MFARPHRISGAAALIMALFTAAQAQEQQPWGQTGQHSGAYGGYGAGPSDAYSPSGGAQGYDTRGGRPSGNTQGYNSDSYYGNGQSGYRNDSYRNDSYRNDNYRNDAYSGGTRSYSDPGEPVNGGGYGQPYSAPPADHDRAERAGPSDGNSYSQNEIIAAGHGFFGAVSKGLGSAVEYAFKSQGRPNGYILGEDAGGAFVVGLRYGEGTLYTKDAGDHKVYWQGPSLGYDAGAEGSKTMVLVYNLRDPSEIYNRFGGAEGSAYLVGGVSVQFQTYGDVTLGIIRSGVGVRLGANVGYLKYTRTPTWNPL